MDIENIEIVSYDSSIVSRSKLHFLIGLGPRIKKYVYYTLVRAIARHRGAKIGKCTVLPYALAKKANANLIIGDHCCISSPDLDIRAPLTIGNFVIIGHGACIINASHNVDSPYFETTYNSLTIEDYCWVINCTVLPGVSKIGRGAVCGTGAVVVRDVSEMAVVGGNPAKVIRRRACVHDQYPPEALAAGDLLIYLNKWIGNVRKKRKA
ncbi:acyltransferase [Syntrophotalea acetylenica]|uniref:acyltransferase n=1 Tax=Syntrophotalea acetylenica TaxID=29542 RepID=UPI0009306BEE|nr:hypothetical protein [Syntrophotalea acetylenica]